MSENPIYAPNMGTQPTRADWDAIRRQEREDYAVKEIKRMLDDADTAFGRWRNKCERGLRNDHATSMTTNRDPQYRQQLDGLLAAESAVWRIWPTGTGNTAERLMELVAGTLAELHASAEARGDRQGRCEAVSIAAYARVFAKRAPEVAAAARDEYNRHYLAQYGRELGA